MSAYAFPWNQVNTLVGDFVVRDIRDQFFKSNAFYYRMKGKVKHYAGGRSIQQPLSWKAEGGGGGWFSGNDRLDTTIRDPLQMAVWYAKNAYVPISIDWDEEQAVNGPTMLKSLIEAKTEIAKNTSIDLVGTDLFNAGLNAKAITGLQYAFAPSTGGVLGGSFGTMPTMTYGGISRSATLNTWWNHNADSAAYTCAAGNAGKFDPLTAGAVMNALGRWWAAVRYASSKSPTMLLGNVGGFTAYHNAISVNDRYMRPQQNSDLAKAGYDNLMYKTAPWVVDERAPRDTTTKIESLYMLNEDTLKLYVHENADFTFRPFKEPHDQAARVAYIMWRGELCCIEPRANLVVSSIDTSAVS